MLYLSKQRFAITLLLLMRKLHFAATYSAKHFCEAQTVRLYAINLPAIIVESFNAAL
ncbi:MAG: hypothetical protein V7784_19830 [Oceanospirillaceae bacterium]